MRGPQAVMNLVPLEGSRDSWQGVPSRWILGSWAPAGVYLAPRRAGSVPLRESGSSDMITASFPELPAGITLVRFTTCASPEQLNPHSAFGHRLPTGRTHGPAYMSLPSSLPTEMLQTLCSPPSSLVSWMGAGEYGAVGP